MAHKIAKLPDHQEVELVGNGSSRGGLENFFSVYPRNTGAQGAGRDDAKHLTREEPGRGKDDGWQETTPLTYGGGGVGDSHGGSIHGGGAEKCSTVKALGHIFISFVGAGVLGLPYAFRRSGMLLGAGFMSLLACLALHAMLLLVQCKRRLEHEGVATYSDIASYALGRFGRRLVETLLVTSQCGFCVAYLVFISKNLASVTGASEAGIVMLLVPPLIALAVLRSLTALAPFSLLADAANVMGMLVVLRDDVLEFKSNAPTLASAGISALPFLFGVVIYCYEGIGMILPIEASMEDRDKFPAVLSMGVFIITGIFITFGMVGYAAYGPNTQDIITSNLPDDWTSTTVKLSLCVGLFFTFPVMLIPVYEIAERAVVSTGWFERNVSPNRRWSVLRVGRATIVTSIALFSIGVPGFGLFISLVGSLCCATLAFVIPAACHLVIFRSKNDLSTWGLVADISLVVFGLIGTVFGVSRTLSDIIERTAA